jgi:hypothetical protein
MLNLGKILNRNYAIRLPFLNGSYDINIFFNKKSSFLLFSIEPDFRDDVNINYGTKVSMFKNLQSSKFCETFLNLHNYKGKKLDIINQFESIKDEHQSDIHFIFNESINLSKYEFDNKTFYDSLQIYGLTLVTHPNEFIFIIAERQNIIQKLNKKIVRTTAIQIGTNNSINMLNEFHDEFKSNNNNHIGLELEDE